MEVFWGYFAHFHVIVEDCEPLCIFNDFLTGKPDLLNLQKLFDF
jgi:hypothetical protein